VVRAISVIIPAFNEERYLPQTLEHLGRARDHLGAGRNKPVEVIVVNNASTDRTAQVALEQGARLIQERRRGIVAARQAGYRHAKYEPAEQSAAPVGSDHASGTKQQMRSVGLLYRRLASSDGDLISQMRMSWYSVVAGLPLNVTVR